MHRWIPARTLILLMAGLLLIPAAAAGADPGTPALPAMEPEFLIDSSDSTDPATALNAAGGECLVVWSEPGGAARGMDILGRRVAADGSNLKRAFRISPRTATGDERDPAVAWNATANEYLVVWVDDRNYDARGYDIYGRRVAADGTRIGRDFRISGRPATGSELLPEVVWNAAANEYFVVWRDHARISPWADDDIFGRRVAADGTRIGREIRVSGRRAFDEDNPALEWNATANEYLVIWEDYRNYSDDEAEVWGRRISPDGVRLAREFRITRAVGDNEWTIAPDLAWNSIGNQYLVVWMSSPNWSTRKHDVYGRRIRADGTRIGVQFRISDRWATDHELYPHAAFSPHTRSYQVVWADTRHDHDEIYGRQVAANGTLIGTAFMISDASYGNLGHAVANPGASEFLVVWEMDWISGEVAGIYGRRVAA